jgi:hypothetical protein
MNKIKRINNTLTAMTMYPDDDDHVVVGEEDEDEDAEGALLSDDLLLFPEIDDMVVLLR